jgi:hypothetical protein
VTPEASPSINSNEKSPRLVLPALMAEIQVNYARFHPENISNYKITLPG